MKKSICLFFAILFLVSCSAKHSNMKNSKEIAVATQRVGEEYYNAGNYTAALKNLLEAYKTIPNDPYLHNSLGLVYLAKQRYDLAEKHFKASLDLKADYDEARNNLGAAYLKQKKWTLAIQCFKAVSESLLYQTPETAFANLGLVYFQQKMYRKALKYFKRSLEMRPNFVIAVHGVASVYINTGNHDRATYFLHQALRKNPDAAILHSDLAKNYEMIKDFEKAKKSWHIVLKLVPETSPLAKEAHDRLFILN